MLDNRIKQYSSSRDVLLRGGLNCIPFREFFPRLSMYLVGLVKGTYYCITSYTNVGKTPLAKFLFVRIPFFYYLDMLGTKNEIKLKIFYFCLEESKEQFIDSLVISELYTRYNITVDYNQLNSLDSPLDSSILSKISELKTYFKRLESILTVIPGVSNPDSIIRIIRNYAAENGKFFMEDREVEAGEEFNRYVPNDPDSYTIIVTDHINLLYAENNDLRTCMSRYSSRYMLNECIKLYGYIACSVQQQAAEGENAEYNKFNKNECSLSTLGDNKIVARDYMVVIALDMPQRYGITEHNNYKLTQFGDNIDHYRSITILKNRFGRSRVRIGTWFVPYAGLFKELPLPTIINYNNYAKFLRPKN